MGFQPAIISQRKTCSICMVLGKIILGKIIKFEKENGATLMNARAIILNSQKQTAIIINFQSIIISSEKDLFDRKRSCVNYYFQKRKMMRPP